MKNVFDVLEERGFIQQVTDEAALRHLFNTQEVTAYIGFDATAKSFHIGSLVPMMALSWLQKFGHRPIVIMGGGTTMIGDPSGRDKTRRIMTQKEIQANARLLKKQFASFLTFRGMGKTSVVGADALMIDNAEWLLPLNLIEFLRDIGKHFSVPRMLSSSAYEERMKRGLTFTEFAYMLLQSYDFLVLFRKYNCMLQMGGDDQWGNILAGVDLIRRVEGATVHALTFPLIETATGEKMGKTAAGAVWLDPKLTSPYEFYQYWINIDDRDAKRFLALFTFLPMDEVNNLGKLHGSDIRQAKEVLAYEATKIVHGRTEAEKAKKAARAVFGGKVEAIEMPTLTLNTAEIQERILLVDLLHEVKLATSRSNARRLIQQGGAYLNDERIESIEQFLTLEDFKNGEALLRVGKKRIHRLKLAR